MTRYAAARRGVVDPFKGVDTFVVCGQHGAMRHVVIALALVVLAGCSKKAEEPAPLSTSKGTSKEEPGSLADARRGFQTKLLRTETTKGPPPAPPAALLRTVQYETPAGKMSAYLGVAPADGRKRPAIVWITGGDSNTIDDGCWADGPADNDQSASAFRKAEILTMYPALRGGSGNPGVKEAFFGEVDDILAAADFLAKQESVDPARIYLGGHSTGGTLALLTAEVSGRFRATFAFGAVNDVQEYGEASLPFDTTNPREVQLRAPGRWLASVRSEVFVLEGTGGTSNIDSLRTMRAASTNARIHFVPVEGADHFSVLQATTRLVAAKILADQGATTSITLDPDEVSALFAR